MRTQERNGKNKMIQTKIPHSLLSLCIHMKHIVSLSYYYSCCIPVVDYHTLRDALKMILSTVNHLLYYVSPKFFSIYKRHQKKRTIIKIKIISRIHKTFGFMSIAYSIWKVILQSSSSSIFV